MTAAIPAKARRRVLLLNAGLNGAHGNTAVLLARARRCLEASVEVAEVVLADGADYATVRPELARADALLVGTGTHWDSWSHRLQLFFETATPDEGSALWLGKPAAAVVTMHSVGGKAVLSRLQGVLNTFGCLIPPMSGMVYSLVNQAALQRGGPGADDVWSPEDIDVICHNLLVALGVESGGYRAWPTDRTDYHGRWIEPEI